MAWTMSLAISKDEDLLFSRSMSDVSLDWTGKIFYYTFFQVVNCIILTGNNNLNPTIFGYEYCLFV